MTDPRYHSSVTDPDETSPISASQLAELREGSEGHDPAPRGDRTVAGGPDRSAPVARDTAAPGAGSVGASSADRSPDRGSNGSPPGGAPAPGSAAWYDQQRYTARPGDPAREVPPRSTTNGQNGYSTAYPGGTGSSRDAAGRPGTGASPGRAAGRPSGPPSGATPAVAPGGASRGRSGPPESPYGSSGGYGGAATGYPSGGTPAAGVTSALYGGSSAYPSTGSTAGYGGSNEATSYAPGGYGGGYGPSSYSSGTVGRDLDNTGTGLAVGGAAGAVGGSFVGGSTLGTSPPRRSGPGRQPRGGAAGRPARRARLMIKQVDPWSTFKFSLVLAVAMFFVWLVAIGVLYGVLDGIGVFNKINDLYSQLSGSDGKRIVTPGLVLGLAALVGAVNIVLTTALATVGAFIYNICSDLVGGIEVTLAERE